MSKHKGGSIYQRGDGLWCVAIEVGIVDGKRKRKVITSKDRDKVVAKLAELAVSKPPKKSRAEYLREARQIATHTPTQWYAKLRTLPDLCRYCDTQLNHFNMVKDHMIALEAGGSDGIDNVQPLCWECNIDKRTTPHDVYVYTGVKPRPFSVFPKRRPEYERVIAKRNERQAAA